MVLGRVIRFIDARNATLFGAVVSNGIQGLVMIMIGQN